MNFFKFKVKSYQMQIQMIYENVNVIRLQKYFDQNTVHYL